MDKKLLKIFSEKWAIMPTEIENICSSDFGDPVWKDSNEPNHKNNVDIRDGIAILHILDEVGDEQLGLLHLVGRRGRDRK